MTFYLHYLARQYLNDRELNKHHFFLMEMMVINNMPYTQKELITITGMNQQTLSKYLIHLSSVGHIKIFNQREHNKRYSISKKGKSFVNSYYAHIEIIKNSFEINH